MPLDPSTFQVPQVAGFVPAKRSSRLAGFGLERGRILPGSGVLGVVLLMRTLRPDLIAVVSYFVVGLDYIRVFHGRRVPARQRRAQ